MFGNCLQEPARCENPALVLSFQNMLVEIEQKVVALSQLSVHNENLLLEGKAHTKDEAEQLAAKLRLLKGSLLELQRALHDRQLSMQVSVATHSPRVSPSVVEERDCGRLKHTHVCTWLPLTCQYVCLFILLLWSAFLVMLLALIDHRDLGGAVLLRQICFSFGFLLQSTLKIYSRYLHTVSCGSCIQIFPYAR